MLYLIKKYRLLFIILIVIIMGIGVIRLLKQIREEKSSEVTLFEEAITSSAESEAGEIGEVKIKDKVTGEEKPLVTPVMPPVIFSTAGTIIEKKTGSLIITGEGTNFADGVSRNLTCIFTDETLTFEKNQLQYHQGKEGLKYLKEGMKILVDSDENIRGKVEFEVKTINVL
jgi:hypothetical protein